MRSIKDNILFYHDSILDLLNALNQGIYGAVVVVDDDGLMVGIFTDGDVRRALLAGASLSEPIERYMNRNFTAGSVKLARADNLKLLTERIRHLPILDEKGVPVDLISWAEMWRLPIVEPLLGGNELKYVSDCITSNWISSQGEYVNRFQDAFTAFHGGGHALCTSNGTTALHLAMEAMGIGPGDEVLVPDLTFGASANAVMHTGATPVFVDIDPQTWTIDPEQIREKITGRTRAIMPVHLYGHPCDMDPIMQLAKAHELFVIEDCAEALGAKYKGQKVGTFGDASCFSFFANKVITTGEGGMVMTNDPELLERMQLLRDHGMTRAHRYWHLAPGYNYRLTNIQAAIGLAQIERIDSFLQHRLDISARYRSLLSDIEGLTLPPSASWAHNIFWLFSIVVDESTTGFSRDELSHALAQEGIETRPFFYPMHEQPAFPSGEKHTFPVTDWVAWRGINLPTSSNITIKDVDRVCKAIRRYAADHDLIKSHVLHSTKLKETAL